MVFQETILLLKTSNYEFWNFGCWKKCQKMDSRINIQDVGIVAMFSKGKMSKFRRDILLMDKQIRFVICTLMWKEARALDLI